MAQKAVPLGTLRNVMKQANISAEDLRKAL